MNEDNYKSDGSINVSDELSREGYNHKEEGGFYMGNSSDEKTGGDQHHAPNTYVGGDQPNSPNTYVDGYQPNSPDTYVGGYQPNKGKTLVKRRGGSGPFGYFGNNRLSGYVSVLGIAIILGILVLVISFFAN